MLTVRQFREARRMLGWTADMLSKAAQVPSEVVYDAELGSGHGSISLFMPFVSRPHANAPAFASATTARFSWAFTRSYAMTGNIPRNYDRRDGGSRAEAEAAFRNFMAKPAEIPAGAPSAAEDEQVVWLRVKKEVLAHFQPEKDGWQDRMSAALRQTAGL